MRWERKCLGKSDGSRLLPGFSPRASQTCRASGIFTSRTGHVAQQRQLTLIASLCWAAFQVSLHLRAHLIPPHSLVSGVPLVSPCVGKGEAQMNTVTSPGGPPSGHVRTWPQATCLQSSPPSLYFPSVSCQAPHTVSLKSKPSF